MPKNSMFAILLRSPWWISIAIAAVMALLAWVLLPKEFRVVGAISGFPFVVIGIIAARRQWRLPSAARVEQTLTAVRAMTWPEFSRLLEQTFEREGYTVKRSQSDSGFDFELERHGRRMLVSAKRWKSARIGVETLRAIQAARETNGTQDALYIGLGELTDSAQPFAAKQGITIWHAAELAQALRGVTQRAKV